MFYVLNAHILTSCLRKGGVQETCPEEPWLSTTHPCPSLHASISPRGGEVAVPGPHLPKRQEASSLTQVLKTLVEMSYCNWLTLGSVHTSVARMCRLLPKWGEGCWANKNTPLQLHGTEVVYMWTTRFLDYWVKLKASCHIWKQEYSGPCNFFIIERIQRNVWKASIQNTVAVM